MRRAFTLLEMMIAILLFSLITVFLSSTLQGLHQSSSALEKKNQELKKEQKLITLLQEDIQQSDTINIVPAKDFISLEMHTLSSIYHMGHAYVRWFVNPEKKLLIRSESAFKLSPPFIDDELHQVHLDPVAEKVKWFKAYISKEKNALFVALNIRDKNLLLEILTPQYEITASK